IGCRLARDTGAPAGARGRTTSGAVDQLAERCPPGAGRRGSRADQSGAGQTVGQARLAAVAPAATRLGRSRAGVGQWSPAAQLDCRSGCDTAPQAVDHAPGPEPDGGLVGGLAGTRDGWISKYDLHNLTMVAEVRAG